MQYIDLTWLSLAMLVVVAYYGALLLHPFYPRRAARQNPAPLDTPPFFVLVIPAHNEEDVIAATLRSLCKLAFPERLILVMNDGSTDRTSEIANSFAGGGVRVIDRSADVAGQGKGAVLNHAFALIGEMVRADDPLFGGRDPASIIVGIMDADGQIEADSLDLIAPYFSDPGVGGVQIGVRIANAPTNLLTRMQDLEFVGFSAFVQEARDAFGSVGLGGNGQFTRLSALQSLDRDPWTSCLTEDLELSLSLVELGWRVRYCHKTYVAQQGLTKWRPLLKQRTRWIQGHYQCWRHFPSLWASRRVALHTKADLSVYLFMVTFVMVVFTGVAASVGALLFGYTVENTSLDWIAQDQTRNFVQLLLSVGPLLAFMLTYQTRSRHPLKYWEIPAFALLFSLFAYAFVISTVWAWARMLTGRGSWAKTPRVVAESVV